MNEEIRRALVRASTTEHTELDARLRAWEQTRTQVVQELVDYIDGDVENGPRYGVAVTEADIDEETRERIASGWAGEDDGSVYGTLGEPAGRVQ